MKQVIKLIEQHCHKTHTDRHNGLEALLDYMIEFFDIKPFMENWYEEHVIEMKNKSEELFEIVLIFMNKVTEAMEKGKWLDFFGELYETMYQSKGKASSLGQFFTPPSICDLMSNIVGEEEKNLLSVIVPAEAAEHSSRTWRKTTSPGTPTMLARTLTRQASRCAH